MNYHIITQDKFFDSYIEDIYKLHEEANNIFWVRGEKGESSLLKTKRKVEYLGKEIPEILVKKLQSLKQDDKLFISWYDMYIGKAIIDSNIPNDIYVWVMGGDFYANPFWYHASWLFDKYTLKFVKNAKAYGYPHVNWKRKPQNWWKVLHELRIKWKFKEEQQKLYEIKLRTIQRIDYLLMSEAWLPEYERVKELYPGCSFKRVDAAFDQNYDIAAHLKISNKTDDTLKILIGNSADITNNYIDAYKYVKKQIRDKYTIYSILSYGDSFNRDYVLRIGKEMFGNAFCPVTKYIDRQEYIDFLMSIDVFVMYHNRQQACGNIMTAITLGKPVFMKSISPIYGMLKLIGVSSVYDVQMLKTVNLRTVVESAQKNRQMNMEKIASVFSERKRLQYWQALLR